MRFPDGLEQRFEQDIGIERSRQTVFRGAVGLVLLDLFLLSDWKLMPDVFDVAVMLRLGILTPITVLVLIVTWFVPPPWVRESMMAVILVLASCVTPILMHLSDSVYLDAGHHGLILVVLYGAIVLRLRFWYALGAAMAIQVIYASILFGLEKVAAEETLSYGMVFSAAVLFSMIASYSLEREQRHGYLLSLRDRLANRELEFISRRDPLTGLGNRRSLEETLARLPRSAGPDEDIAVVLLDVDHFKAYNDTLGHIAGDLCLQQVSQVVRGCLRTGDQAFRFGGEEFLVLLRYTDLGGAQAIAERMRDAIEQAAIPHPETRKGRVTASFGAASAKLGAEVAADEIIAAADSALYAAKRAGRNQVWPRVAGAPFAEPERRRQRS